MKTKFSKGLSIFLSIVLVISVLALPNVFNVAANGELPTEVTRKLITEADNDYQSSAALTAPYATNDDNSIANWFSVEGGRNYSGTIVPTYDPLDTTGENKVLRHRPYGDAIGIIRLGDEYLTPTTTGGIIAEVGKTYKISFKWMTEGYTQAATMRFGVGLAKADYADEINYANDIDDSSVQILKTFDRYTTVTNEWADITTYFEVTDEMDISTYPQLVIWVEGGVKYAAGWNELDEHIKHGTCAYFDDITVTSLAKYTETVYANNDFSTANTNVTKWATMKYRGNSFVGIDPDNSSNKVVQNQAGLKDLGVIFLNDGYTSGLPKNFIKATAGTTYTINFKWKYDGTQEKGETRIGVGLAQTPVEGDDGTKYSYPKFTILDADSEQIVTSVATGTYSDVEWKTETVRYTVSDTADLTTYPNLVLYTQNTDAASGISYYFDDITVKSLSGIEQEIFCDENLVDSDFSNANYGNVEKGSAYKYRGASFVGKDPDDADNKVVENQAGYKDLGVIYLNDAYTSNLPRNFIEATAGTTYTITFKWKYNGTQTSGETKIGVGLAQTPVESDNGSKFGNYTILDSDSKQVITSVAAGTYSDVEWKTETVRYTVSDTANLTNYPNLVLYTQNTGSGSLISYYFDDVSVSTKIAAATVNFVYEGNVESNFATVEKSVYFEDGVILDYQPEELPVGVKWYIDDKYSEEYDFTKDYTEYMDITLYGVSQYVKGDINADGSINARDMVLMRQYLLEQNTGTKRFYDINNDNEIDIRDLVSLKKSGYSKVNELSTVTLSLYGEEGNTYSYGVAWQSDVQLAQPVVEIMQADESDWANAKRIVGNSSNSVSHQTFQIKEGWDYGTISDDYKAAGGTGAWYYSGITKSHDISVIYSNKLIISGLKAGQSYKYRVGDLYNDKYSGEGTFTAYNNTDNSFNFIYMSDSQQSFASSNVNAWRNTLGAAFRSMNDAEFIAMGGDLINWNAIEAQWKGLLDYNKNYVMNIPIMPAAGNHEINMTVSGTGIEYGDFNSHFNVPYTSEYDVGNTDKHYNNGATGTYYSYDYKNVHFVVLNTNDIYVTSNPSNKGKYVLSDAQMAWLNADLSDAKQREESGEINFTIVYMHAGLYTTGAAGLGKDYKETVDLYDQLQYVFADYNVDLVLSGHDHTYSRTKVLDKNGTVSENGGVVYMTGGVASVNAPGIAYFENSDSISVGASKLNTADKYEYYAKQTYTNCWTELSVTSNAITVNTFSGVSATPLDSFTVTKNNLN